MIGDVHIVPDIVQQCSNFQNQSRFIVQFVNRLRLSENWQGQSRDNSGVFFVERVFPSQASSGFDDLAAVGAFFVIADFGNDFEKKAVFQPDAGNDDFRDTCLLDDFLQDD